MLFSLFFVSLVFVVFYTFAIDSYLKAYLTVDLERKLHYALLANGARHKTRGLCLKSVGLKIWNAVLRLGKKEKKQVAHVFWQQGPTQSKSTLQRENLIVYIDDKT